MLWARHVLVDPRSRPLRELGVTQGVGGHAGSWDRRVWRDGLPRASGLPLGWFYLSHRKDFEPGQGPESSLEEQFGMDWRKVRRQ